MANLVCGIPSGLALPSDPNNVVTLHAYAVYGGIQLGWPLPTVNPHSLAYAKVFRAASNDFTAATEIGTGGPASYLDRLSVSTDTTYYYWIKLVSLNGTVFPQVGPASAVAKPNSSYVTEDLREQITGEELNPDLVNQINYIQSLDNTLLGEIADRAAENARLGRLIVDANGVAHNALTVVESGLNTVSNQYGSLVEKYDLLGAVFDESIAGYVSEVNLLVGPNSAYGKKIDGIATKLGFTTAEAKMTIETNIDALTEKVDASVSLDVNANGNIAGFKLGANATTSYATFDVANFKIGSGEYETAPFEVSGNEVRIASAAIGDATITNAHIANLTLGTSKFADNSMSSLASANGLSTSVSVPANSTVNIFATLSYSGITPHSTGASSDGTLTITAGNNTSSANVPVVTKLYDVIVGEGELTYVYHYGYPSASVAVVGSFTNSGSSATTVTITGTQPAGGSCVIAAFGIYK